MTETELKDLHKQSNNNKRVLLRKGEVGCFHCVRTFHVLDMRAYIDGGNTALCPLCSVDAVLPTDDIELLGQMEAYWFGSTHIR